MEQPSPAAPWQLRSNCSIFCVDRSQELILSWITIADKMMVAESEIKHSRTILHSSQSSGTVWTKWQFFQVLALATICRLWKIPPVQIISYVTLILLEGIFGVAVCDKAIFVQSRQHEWTWIHITTWGHFLSSCYVVGKGFSLMCLGDYIKRCASNRLYCLNDTLHVPSVSGQLIAKWHYPNTRLMARR